MSFLKSFRKALNVELSAPAGSEPNPEYAGSFTPRATQVLSLAKREAERLRHYFVGTEHLLLALISLETGVAFNVPQETGAGS